MKKKSYILALSVLASTAFTSCIGDLDTVPLNETDKTANQAYGESLESYEMGLAYVYGSFCLVSQNDPGSSDIAVSDAGQSELVRQFVNLNEMSADALKCTWGDSYITDSQNATWSSAGNTAITAVYTRCMMTITRANEFLNQTAGKELAGLDALRAEARFYRAFANWMMMDIFGNPPYATEDLLGTSKLPSQVGRAQLFSNIENELLAVENLLPETNTYPRVSKGAAQALLARLYLNAEVYTGKARWTDAKNYAEKVIKSGAYALCTEDKPAASAYEQLFLYDNGENPNSQKEMVFAIAYDKDYTQSWGGTTHLVSGALDDATSQFLASQLGYPEGSMISRERWNGYHVPNEFVERTFDLNGVEWGNAESIGFDRATSDKRALITNFGCKKDYDATSVQTGWRCWKFSSRDSEGNLYSSDDYTKFSSIDFPMIRLAEMYLTYAEATVRENGGADTTDPTALGYVNALRDRAGLGHLSFLSLDNILKELGAEFMWEGHRRVDLIRYGYFTSMNFSWPYKGGIPNGKASLPGYRTIYPLLTSDMTENPNLVQNPGY